MFDPAFFIAIGRKATRQQGSKATRQQVKSQQHGRKISLHSVVQFSIQDLLVASLPFCLCAFGPHYNIALIAALPTCTTLDVPGFRPSYWILISMLLDSLLVRSRFHK